MGPGFFALAKGGSGRPLTPADMLCVGIGFGGMVAVFSTIAFSISLAHRKRRRKISEAAQLMGMQSIDPKSPGAGLVGEPARRGRGERLRVCSVGVVEDRAARLAEFTLTIGGGRHRRIYHNLQLSLECPDSWPSLVLWAAPGADAIWYVFCRARGASPDATFRNRWRLSADQLAAVAAKFSPALRAVFLNGPLHECWVIRSGWISCTWRRPCTDRDVPQLVNRVQAVRAALTDAFGSTS
jgi:hypothetical protein